ncbi:MAG: hypothetical protein V4574_18725 [Pseudomonadota bacterium]
MRARSGRASCVLALLLSLCPAAAWAQGLNPGARSNSGIAIGGNVSNSSLTVHISSDDAADLVRASSSQWRNLTEKQRKELARLERELGITQGALRTFFAIIGDNNVAPEDLPRRLGEVASQYLSLRSQLDRISESRQPQVAALKRAAQEALNAGQFRGADEILQRVEALENENLSTQMLERAETAAQRGTLAMSELRYQDAAERFADSVRFAGENPIRWSYLHQRAEALFTHANLFEDASARTAAIEVQRELMAHYEQDPHSDPVERARARRQLAAILLIGDQDRLNEKDVSEAQRLLDDALSLLSDRNSEDGQRLSDLLAISLCVIGKKNNDADMIGRGITILIDLVKSVTDKKKEIWTIVNNNLADCYALLAEISGERKYYVKSYNSFYNTYINRDAPFKYYNKAIFLDSFAYVTGKIANFDDDRQLYSLAVYLSRQAFEEKTMPLGSESLNRAQWHLADSLIGLSTYGINVSPIEEALQLYINIYGSDYSDDKRDILGFYILESEMRIDLLTKRYSNIRNYIPKLRRYVEIFSAHDDLSILSDAKYYLHIANFSELLEVKDRRDNEKPLVYTYSIVQISLIARDMSSPLSEVDARRLADAFKDNRACWNLEARSRALGANYVVNDRIHLSDLPTWLADIVAKQRVWEATPAFGDTSAMRLWVLCGKGAYLKDQPH